MKTYSCCLWVKLDGRTSEQCSLFLWTLLHTLNSSQLMTTNTAEVYRQYTYK